MNILNVEKVSKTYGEKQLFDEVTLGVNKGDKIGVIGVNGTGKSTFLKIIAGLEEADAGQVVKGKGVTVAYLEQKAQFPEKDTILGYVLRGKQHSSEAEAKTILTKLGITEFDKDIHTLSGGQKKRVALAKTLVEPAEVLILDEPTNHLDNEMVIWLEDYIRQFKGELLMVTHDRYFLDNVTNRIVELDRTHLYSYDTNYSGFLELKTQREQMEMATEEKRQNILRRELEWIRRGCQARSTKQQARIDRYEDMKEASRQARASFEKQAMEMNSVTSRLGKKTIELENITKAYDGITYIRDFSYIFLRDDRIGIIGRNGCGKSTLMKIITGQIQPDSGTVSIGETVKIGYFMQENEPLDEKMTVLEYVRSIGEYVTTATGKATASQMCERFLFTPKMQWTPIEKLSGGEKRRLYLLSVLMSAPNVLILDEPTNDLDVETLELLEELIDGYQGTVMLVSHDRQFVDNTVTECWIFEGEGRIGQYVGGYHDAKGQQAQSLATKQSKSKISSEPAVTKAETVKKTSAKLSYNLQRELEGLPQRLEELEAALEDLQKQVADASFFTQSHDYTQKVLAEMSAAEKALEDAFERWEYLESLKNGA